MKQETGKDNTRQPGWISKAEVAIALRISKQAFEKWNVQPIAKVGRTAFYRLGDIIANRVERDREKNANRNPPDVTVLEAEQEKTLLIRAQREGQELRNAQTRSELVPLDLLSWTLAKVASQISAILDAVPLKVKNILPRLSAAEVEHIRREIVKAKNAAASVGVNLDEYYQARSDKRAVEVRVA